jgi:two-component system, response regulator YesN
MNIFKNTEKKRTFFSKLLFTFLAVITVTIVLVSSILYVNFEKIAIKQANTYVTDNLLKVCSGTQFMVDWVKLMLIQMYRDNDIQNMLFDNAPDPVQISNASNRLASYQASSPFFRSIYLYNGGIDTIYYPGENVFSFDRNSFHDSEVFNYLDDRSSRLHMTPIPRVIGNLSNNVEIKHNVFTFIMFDNPSSITSYPNAVILNFSEDLLKDIIKTLNPNKKGEIVVIDEEGRTMISSSKHPFLSNMGKADYAPQVLEAEKDSGSFVSTIQGDKFLVNYVYPEVVIPESYKLSWRYINLIPYSELTGEIQTMRKNTLLFLLLFLGVGIPIIILLSRYLYAPVSELKNNIDKLEMEKQKNNEHLKQDFLRKLLFGEIQYTENELSAEFREYDLQVDPFEYFILFLVRIDDYNSFRDRFDTHKRNELKKEIIRLINMNLPNRKIESVSLEEDTIAVILNTDNNSGNELENIVGEIQRDVKDNIDLTISITIGNCGKNLVEDINLLYTRTFDVSHNRYFLGRECVIDCNRIKIKPALNHHFPYGKEKIFTEMLLMNKLAEGRMLFREILNSTRGFSFSIFQTSLQRLVLAVHSVLDTLRKNSLTSSSDNLKSPLTTLFTCDTVEEIENQLFPYLEKTIPLFQVKKEHDHNRLITYITDDIKKHYSNPRLCAEQYAEECGLSPIYLGRLFKQYTTNSIAEYINITRVEKGKELLVTTDNPVNEIVKKIGFTYENYFYSIFKKYNGVTPTEYRQKQKDSIHAHEDVC